MAVREMYSPFYSHSFSIDWCKGKNCFVVLGLDYNRGKKNLFAESGLTQTMSEMKVFTIVLNGKIEHEKPHFKERGRPDIR